MYTTKPSIFQNLSAVKKAIIKLLSVFVLFVAFFMLQKVLFMLCYHKLMPTATFADRLSVIWHGLPMDFSVAGYLSAIPAIMITAGIWLSSKWTDMALKVYFAVISALLAAITLIDLGLYGYWGFRLDITPIFYFTTSPAAALASATWHQILIGIIGTAVIAYGIYLAFSRTVCRIEVKPARRVAATIVMLVLTAALFIPIRGGFTVSTMNPGRVYFSHDKIMNHAAINPAFSLLYSATHQNDFSNTCKYMTNDDAAAEMAALAEISKSGNNDTVVTDSVALACTNPDIYLIILESFSAHLMPSLGGESIAECLDSVAKAGISFTNFYANSIRTDRALPSILSGFPAQPSMSLLKYAEKAEKLPSIAKELKKAGYGTTYYYGGDINFANVNAYLVSAGYDRIIRDNDFPITERQSKWGAHDHLLFNRALTDALASDMASDTPAFKVIQTSSSHEPFEVPFSDPRFASSPQKNAFAYTDRCLHDFLEGLKKSPRYGCTLVVIVPDHLGAWPLNLTDAANRHHVPLVITGGALNNKEPLAIPTPGSQIDIAATLLGMLGIDASAFTFSKNLLHRSAPHYAVFTEPSLIGIVTATDTIVYDIEADHMWQATGPHAAGFEPKAKAYLQTIYQTISNL